MVEKAAPVEPVGMDPRTKRTLAWQLHEQGLSNCQIARHLQAHRETVGLWIRGIEAEGLLPFLEGYRKGQRAPRPSRQVPLSLKQTVWALRERQEGCCGQKIAYFLEKEHTIRLSVPKIYEILAEKYVLRGSKPKNQKRGPVPQAFAPREVVQMDTIDLGKVLAFTAVDIFSKEADVYLAPALTAAEGRAFLEVCMRRRFAPGRVGLVQTDGGPEFKGEFAEAVLAYCDRHRVSRPYKKNEQSYIESFNRSVRSECLGWAKYRAEAIAELRELVAVFLDRYHYHRPHLGLEPMRPPLVRERANT